ncbi:MAG TPA: serine/threonine-protein kinase, partial [Myxococcota bacterium]|nr:serine/threonine-protein kinase [Myxococcota bacterium]
MVRCLGQGGSASVWEALDRRSSPVAIKILPRQLSSDRHRAQVEVAALRWLQLPGVVRFLDEGEEEDCFWIAMELVQGNPFPGRPGRLPWEHLAPLALRLLHILGGVHRAGVLHRDLKPSNVFVGTGDRVVLLDFGIASGEALSDLRKDPREGTRVYLAPECRNGAQPNFSTDLYAAGVMFRQVLTGVYDDLAPLPAEVPASVAEMLDRMVATDRSLRPTTAEEAALGLGRPARHWKVAEPLEDLFHGPRHYLHLPQRGAERLRDLTGGDLSRVPALLHTWEQQGIGRWEGERMVLDRLAVVEWSGPEEEELARRLQAGETHATLYRASIDLARRLLDAGHTERALRLCERAMELGPGQEEVAMLAAEAAARLESMAGLNRAICLLRRCPPSPRLQALDRLLRATELTFEGRGPEALPKLDWWLAPLPEGLEMWRMGIRFLALRAQPGEAEALEQARSWARSPERLARWKGWMGNFLYRQQKYVEAARMHEESGSGRKTPDTRLTAQRAAAAAWLEEGELERAHQLAATVREGAESLGQP